MFERSEERPDKVRESWMEMGMKVVRWNPIGRVKYYMFTHLVSTG